MTISIVIPAHNVTHGRMSGRCHEIICSESITTSCRKFAEFGGWHFVSIFGNPLRVRRAIAGTDRDYLSSEAELDRIWTTMEQICEKRENRPHQGGRLPDLVHLLHK